MEVTVIGLGDMGAALVRALLKEGHRVTIWNRTASRAETLVNAGAVLVPDVAAAISASPVIINCVKDYSATREIFGTAEATAALAGRTLIELSSGTPGDARGADTWAGNLGIDYLDGAILAIPGQIGRPDTPIFVSGSQSAFSKSEVLLRALAGNLQYMGEAPGLAAAWDMLFLVCLFGGALGFIHGARICQAEGISVSAYGDMIGQVAPVIGEMLRHIGHVIESGDFTVKQSSIDTCASGADIFLRQAKEAGINNDWPVFTSGLLRKAQAAGLGKQELASMVMMK